MKYLAILIAILFSSCTAFAQQCYTFGHACGGSTTTQCCDGLVCATLPGSTVTKCIQSGTTTSSTSTTSTSTTQPGATTTTTLPVPPANEFGFMFTPADLGALLHDGESCQYTGHIVDPRTGQPANQLLLAAMGWQFEQYSMEMVALADAVGCPFNDQQIEDSNFKFGADYVLLHQAAPTGGTYQWMQPTYVRQYTCAPILATAGCLQDKGVLPDDLAQVAGLEDGDLSPPPSNPDFGILDGELHYSPGYYPPLTPDQCAALQAADDAHMAHDNALLAHDYDTANANNPAVAEAQRAFEATAADISQAVLFKWQWQGNYNFGNPVDVLDGLTRKIIAAHHNVMLAYNCATGQSPDVGHIVHFEMQHNLLHDCRATTHWLDVPIPTVCDTTQIQSCPKQTCRQQAGS